MRKKIRRYTQSDHTKCGPACMLMLLDLYGKLRMPPFPKRAEEMQLYNQYRCHVRYPGRDEEFPGVNGAAIACHLSSVGLKVRLVHSSENMMDNRDGYFPGELFDGLLAEYQERAEACKDRIELITGAEITCDTLREELDAGRQIILETIVPGNADGIHDRVLHWIVVYGHEGDVFRVCDPGYRQKTTLTVAEMTGFMDTPIGKIYLAVGGEDS